MDQSFRYAAVRQVGAKAQLVLHRRKHIDSLKKMANVKGRLLANSPK